MVERHAPIEASVIATSGASNNKYKIQTKELKSDITKIFVKLLFAKKNEIKAKHIKMPNSIIKMLLDSLANNFSKKMFIFLYQALVW